MTTDEQLKAITQLVVEMRKNCCTTDCKIEIVLNHKNRTIAIEHMDDESLVLTEEDQANGRIQNLIRRHSNRIHNGSVVSDYVGV